MIKRLTHSRDRDSATTYITSKTPVAVSSSVDDTREGKGLSLRPSAGIVVFLFFFGRA